MSTDSPIVICDFELEDTAIAGSRDAAGIVFDVAHIRENLARLAANLINGEEPTMSAGR